MKVTIIGAGSWGSALARLLADNNHSVLLYDISQETIDEINQFHTNLSKLPQGTLPITVVATTNLFQAINSSDIIVLSVPTKVIRETLIEMAKVIQSPKLFVNASKGLEPLTHKRVSEIVKEEIPQDRIKGFVALTGPSHAEEVIQGLPTAICSASESSEDAKLIQTLFSNTVNFRVYTLNDLIGAELGGALKNVYAVASGMLEGLGYGDNARAALISRALFEMTKLAVALGAKEATLFGLTGLGDLVVTTSSHHSRNFQAGVKLSQGKNLEQTIQSIPMVVEGFRTTLAAYDVAKLLMIDTPIIDAVYSVIYEKQDVKLAVQELMMRALKDEFVE